MLLVLDWVEKKDLKRIAQWIDPSLLGTFVKVHLLSPCAILAYLTFIALLLV